MGPEFWFQVQRVSWPCGFEFTSNLLDSKHTNLELIGKWKIWRCHHWICPKALFIGVRHIVNCEVGA
ncbi:unnamed protein product [Prunus armeniaca]